MMFFQVLLGLQIFQRMLSGFGSIRDGIQCGFGAPSVTLFFFFLFLVTVGLRHLAIVMHRVQKKKETNEKQTENLIETDCPAEELPEQRV